MNREKLINSTFKSIEKITNGNFTTLRNFDFIPEQSSIENDIDVLVPNKYISDLVENCKDNYFIYQDQNPCLYGAEPHIHFKNEELDVHFDIVTGLYYRSSNDSNLFIKVNDELEKSMLEHKTLVDDVWLSQPSSEDELVHLACHCIFDKKKVTKRYEDRMNYLFKDCQEEKLNKLLEIAFYKTSNTIFESLSIGNSSKIYENYISFTDY